ncbi:MAG: cytochrome c biogenesis protein ResB [Rhodoluna sp.]
MASRQQSKYVVRKEYNEPIEAPDLSAKSWLRWIWKQLTSMKIALFLLLLLAIAAVPGSIYPQRSADPNGVALYFKNNPDFAKVLDSLQLFDVYASSWFSAIYLLLFISLIGCLLPRIGVHYKALREKPPAPPTNLSRLPQYKKVTGEKVKLEAAFEYLTKNKYKVIAESKGKALVELRAEKGYLRETGNLIFHISLVGVLISVALGGALSFNGQRVLVEGETFVNNRAAYDSYQPGLLFSEASLQPFSMRLDQFSITYDYLNPANYAKPLDFRANVSTTVSDQQSQALIRVNEPIALPNAKVYLTGNGFAPEIIVRDPDGTISFSGPVVFLPQDANMTSLGVIKVPDAKKQFGMMAFFYPTVGKLSTGALTSTHPNPFDPVMTLNVYVGDLGIDKGINNNVYELDTHLLKQIAGGKSGTKALKLQPGDVVELPQNLGTVEFKSVKRFASLDITYNPLDIWVLISVIITFFGLILMLLIPRRRIWVRKLADGAEVGALAKSRDESLERIVKEISQAMKKSK